MNKPTDNQYPLQSDIQARWSPYAFAETPLTTAELGSIFEAARWAPSAYNEQPWRFVIASKDADPDTYAVIFGSMIDWNKMWTATAPILIAVVAKKTFSHDGSANPWGPYDAGQAAAYLSLQATSMGLYTHQMAGFDPTALTEGLDLSDDYAPVALIALGHLGNPDTLPIDPLKDKHNDVTRSRKPLSEVVLTKGGETSPLLG